MKLIGIIGAMEVEVASLKEMMTDVTIRTKASMEFNHGYLNGKEVVVVRSGIGKVNAGICTQILVDDYGVDCVIISFKLATSTSIAPIIPINFMFMISSNNFTCTLRFFLFLLL